MTTSTRSLAAALIIVLAGTAASMHGLGAQRLESLAQPAGAGETGVAQRAPSSQAVPSDDREAAICRQMAAAMQESEARIESLAAKMDAAKGDDRAAVMAELVLALANDRLLMRRPPAAGGSEPLAEHHMTTPSRAQGAGLVARGQMQHLMESMASAMRQPRMDAFQMMSRCAGVPPRGGETR